MDWLPPVSGERGHSLALIDDDSTWSYRELVAATAAAAQRLTSLGIGPGSTLLWEARASCVGIIALHAAFRAGATVAPVRPGLNRTARCELAARIDASGQLSAGDEPLGPEGLLELRFDDLMQPTTGDALSVPIDPQRVATVMQTSGGGGPAKLVPLRWCHHLANFEAVARRLGLSAGDRWLMCLPLHHIGGLAILLRAAWTGAGVRLHAGFDAERILALLEQRGEKDAITHVSLVPTQLRRILQRLDRPLSGSLRCVLVGGAAAEPELLARARRLGFPVVPTWGMTEAGSQLATPSLDQAAALDFLAEPGRIGPPLDGVELRPAAPGTGSGELFVRSPSIFEGYVDRSGGPDEEGWFATGDCGVVDQDGWIRITGRSRDRIISGGENVDPRAIERALLAAGLVEDVSILGLPDAEWGERVVAVAVSALDADALKQWARRHLEPHQRPRQWRLVEALPQTDSGKPDRRALERLFAD
jgi:O-succinylbenzoic acid--CoA ligase